MSLLRVVVLTGCSAFVVVAACPAQAQGADSTALVRLELVDGTVLVGTVVSEDSTEVVLRTVGGTVVAAPVGQVRRRGPYAGAVRGGRLVRTDPNRTRLMFGPTARSLRRGQGYLAVYELVLPFVAYGPGAGVSLSGGTVFAPGAIFDVFYVAPKVTVVETTGAALALGTFVVATTESRTDCSEDGCEDVENVVWGALPLVVGTLGSAERAVTVGAGVPVGEGGVGGALLLMLGGELQVSNSVKLLTESYIELGQDQSALLAGGGVRFFGERIAADLGAFLAVDAIGGTDFIPFIPWLGFSYAFGH